MCINDLCYTIILDFFFAQGGIILVTIDLARCLFYINQIAVVFASDRFIIV
jgi:hypothetical protein